MNSVLTTQELNNRADAAQNKRGFRFYLKRGLLILVALLVALPLFGFTYETIMAAGDAQRYPAPGQLVSVDGYAMHIRCVGGGSPTVILEQGAAGFSAMWPETIITELSQTSRVCAYDRAGYGWSDPRPEPRTAWEIVHELHSLLTTAHIEPPYVLVGTSNGGLYVRSYAVEYPAETAGLVLVAATSEVGLENVKGLPSGVLVAMGRLGIFRLFPEMICPGSACDEASKPMIAAFRGRAALYQTYDAEWKGLQSPDELNTLRERLSPAGSLGDTPLVILTANQSGLPESEMPADYRAMLSEDRELMSRLSSNSRYVVVISGHGLAIEHPELVVQSVKDVFSSATSGQPLAQ